MKTLLEFGVKYFTQKDEKKNILAQNPDENFIPYSIHYDAKTILTKNGELMQIIRVSGFSNTSVYAELIPLREAVRDAIRDNIKQTNFALWFSTIRRKKNISPDGEFADYFSNKINQTWEEINNLQNDYVNELYITVIVEGIDTSIVNFKSLVGSFSKNSTRKLHESFLAKSLEILTNATSGILSAISDYGAKILEIKEWEGVLYSEQMRFLGKICHLQEKFYPVSAIDISEDLSANKIAFGNNEIEVLYGNNLSFATVLSLKEYIEINIESLDKILQLPFEFVISQAFDFSYNESELAHFKYQDKILRISEDASFRDISGIANFFESVDGTATDYGKLQTTIMIISKTREELDRDVKLISEQFQALGVIVVREDLFMEDCFWSQLPANFRFLKRQKIVNSYKIAGFSSLYSFASGSISGNYWGPAVATFKTITNTPYFFSFHDGDQGHSMFLGKKSSGKTVLLNFILAQARRFKSKIFYFDFDNKAKNFINMLGGFYYDLSYSDPQSQECLKINPLDLNINPNFRKFLSEFFYSFIYKYKAGIPEEELQNITKIVDKILIEKCNKFSDAIKLFNTEETKKIYEILKFWEEPVLARIFDHDREINWSDRIMGFDLTEYAEKDFIVVPILYYILYKIENIINEETPSIVVFKNAEKLLNNEIFTDKIINLLDRFKLKNCVVIFCFDAEDLNEETENLINLVSQRVSSKFILSDFNVSEDLKNTLKISDEELRLINYFKNEERKFLLKFGDNSLVANFNLSQHKSLIRLLSSSFEDVAIVEEIFNHSKESGKIIDNETALKQFYEVVDALEQEIILQKQEEERQKNLAMMRRARGLS
jgi:type IV secretion system protein VirB4